MPAISSSGRVLLRAAAVCLLLGVLSPLYARPTSVARAQPDWELLAGSGSAIVRLWTLSSGAVFVRDHDGALFLSQNGGDDWQPIPAPPDGSLLAPDPTELGIVYGISDRGVLKSTDGGATWRVILPSPGPPRTFAPQHLAISPADHNLLYVVEPIDCCEPLSVVRSRDGGSSWQTATEISRAGAPCAAFVSILVPHPTDPRRVFSDQGCYAGRNIGQRVSNSSDQGATWSTIFRDGQAMVPERLIGGLGADPRRLYLTVGPWMSARAARLFRSDDDGATWSQILEAGDQRSTSFGGLAYDPDQPDHVFVATGRTPNPDDTGVRATEDGGQTWSFLGRQDIGWVNDLARSGDGTLFAATNEGVWRLRPEQTRPTVGKRQPGTL